jgi:hypothetical protein
MLLGHGPALEKERYGQEGVGQINNGLQEMAYELKQILLNKF